MKHYRLKAISQDTDIVHVSLEPKTSSDQLDFYPGQYVTIGFRGKHGRRTPMRCFSIVSSPLQPEELQLAMRLGGHFTRTLSQLTVGTDIYLEGPFGDFVIDERYDRNVVMLAGGIGITPFMSMIRTACLSQNPLPITLLHSYRTGHNIPFHEELQQLVAQNPQLQVTTFVTNQTTLPESPRLLSGRIGEKQIEQLVSSRPNSTFFLCGPKGFMDNTQALLRKYGVRENRIITETFTQSSEASWGNYSIPKLTYAFAALVLVVGISGVAFLDISRYVPKYVQAAGLTSPNSTTTTSSTTQANSDDTSTTTTNGNSSYNAAPTQTYSQPVTSVS